MPIVKPFKLTARKETAILQYLYGEITAAEAARKLGLPYREYLYTTVNAYIRHRVKQGTLIL